MVVTLIKNADGEWVECPDCETVGPIGPDITGPWQHSIDALEAQMDRLYGWDDRRDLD